DRIRQAARFQQLVAEWEPDGIEAGRRDLVQHVLPVARPQAMRRKVGRLQAKPVHAGEPDLVTVAVHEFPVFGAKGYRRRRWTVTRCGSLVGGGRTASLQEGGD